MGQGGSAQGGVGAEPWAPRLLWRGTCAPPASRAGSASPVSIVPPGCPGPPPTWVLAPRKRVRALKTLLLYSPPPPLPLVTKDCRRYRGPEGDCGIILPTKDVSCLRVSCCAFGNYRSESLKTNPILRLEIQGGKASRGIFRSRGAGRLPAGEWGVGSLRFLSDFVSD